MEESKKSEDIANGDQNVPISVPRVESVECTIVDNDQQATVPLNSEENTHISKETTQPEVTAEQDKSESTKSSETLESANSGDFKEATIESDKKIESKSSDPELIVDSAKEAPVLATDTSISTMEVVESIENVSSDPVASIETAKEMECSEPELQPKASNEDLPENVSSKEATADSAEASMNTMDVEESTEKDQIASTETANESAKETENVAIPNEIVIQQHLETEAVKNINSNSLSLLCQYSGSSESESEDTVAPKTVESIHQSSSSSDESEDEEVETGLSRDYRKCTDAILVSDAETMDTNAVSSDDDDDDELQSQGPIRTKGEILVNELPPIEELTITVPETECKPIGLVDSIVAQIVLVQSIPGVELLNLDTVLFLDRGKRPLGKIFDVIGQVNCPIYCVLFNSNQEIVAKNITVGLQVYCAPRTEHTSFIILSELMRFKGSDASWMNDNEPPSHMVEYSDDEAEKTAKKNRKKRNNSTGEVCEENVHQQQHHQQQRQQYHPHQNQYQQPYNQQQQQQHYRHQHPHSGQQQFQNPYMPRPQFRRPPPNNRGNFYPQQRSGYSWHHNVNNPRYQNPQQNQQQFAQYQQQQPHPRQYQHPPTSQHQHPPPPPHLHQQQFHHSPNTQQSPPGSSFLPNPFAMFGPQPPNQP